MPPKKKRLLFRSVILIFMIGLIGFTLYNNYTNKTSSFQSGLKIQDTPPDFILKKFNNEDKIILSDLKGKVILINFWGTWCKPCKREMPAIQSVYDEYHKSGFEVLAINIEETPFVVERFSKELNLSFPILLDSKGEVNNEYNVYNLPASILIGRDGKIKEIHEGEISQAVLTEWVTNNL